YANGPLAAQRPILLSVTLDRRADHRLAIQRRFLEHDLIMLTVSLNLAQADQQILPILGEPQGCLPLGVGLAYAFDLHGVKLPGAGGDAFLTGDAEAVFLYLVFIRYPITHLGLACHQIALQGQLISGAVEQSGFGRQAEGFLLMLAGDYAGFPVKVLCGHAATAQALALVAITERDQLVVLQPQLAFLVQPCDEHAVMEGQGPGTVGVGLQAVRGLAVDRNLLHVGSVAGGKGNQLLRVDQAAAESQYRGGQPAARATEQERTAVNHANDLAYLRRIDPA